MPDEREEIEELDVLVTFDSDERVRAYRRDVLMAAGFSELLASLLADNGEVDLHKAVRMVEQGCDPLTAAKILL